jgi:hypothetical protein
MIWNGTSNLILKPSGIRCLSAVAGFIALNLAVPSRSHANFISNGSFEDVPIAADSVSGSAPAGWNGGFLLFNGNIAGWPGPLDGNQFESIGWGVGLELSQTFNLALAGDYQLSWYDNAAIGYQYGLDVLIDGTSLKSYLELDTAAAWSSRQETITLAAGNHTLSFIGDASASADVLIDDVRLISKSVTSTIPDTGSTFCLMGGVLAGLGWLSRNQRQRVRCNSAWSRATLPGWQWRPKDR